MPPKAVIDLFSAIESNDKLSPMTKRNYSDRIKALTSKAGDNKTIMDIIMHPDTYIPRIHQWYPLPTSFKMNMTAVLALFRYNPKFKEKNKAVHEKWVKAFHEADEKVNMRYEENKPTERQAEGYVPYETIIEVRDKLPEGHIHRLLLDMYTHLKPMRCEYSRVALYRSKVPTSPEPNYILIQGKKGKMVLRHFKTRKHHDEYNINLPSPLMTDLLKSLEESPRDWLFANTKGEPYTTTLYTQWTIRTFKSLFGKPLTVSLIRHSYINTIDFNTLSIREKKDIATAMGHTMETQDRYRLIFTDKNAECDCTCTPKPS